MLNIIAGVALAVIGSPEIAYAQAQQPSFPVVGYATTTQEGLQALVWNVQREYGLGDDFYKTAACESQFTPKAVGDHGTSFGMWQIHRPAHPTITKKQAFDPIWATTWAARQFKEGRASMWSCWRSQSL